MTYILRKVFFTKSSKSPADQLFGVELRSEADCEYPLKKQSSIADHETGDVAFGNFSETVMVSKETNVRYRPEKSYLEYMQMFDF